MQKKIALVVGILGIAFTIVFFVLPTYLKEHNVIVPPFYYDLLLYIAVAMIVIPLAWLVFEPIKKLLIRLWCQIIPGSRAKPLTYTIVTIMIISIILISVSIISIRNIAGPEYPTEKTVQTEQTDNPQVDTLSKYAINDDFSGSLQWQRITDLPGSGNPEPPQVSGRINIQNGALHIYSDSYWYNVFAVRQFAAINGDFQTSVKTRIMPDSPDATNVGIMLCQGDILNYSNRIICFAYDGYYKKIGISSLKNSIDSIDHPIDKDRWTSFSIRRTNNIYNFSLNDTQLFQWISNKISPIDSIALGAGTVFIIKVAYMLVLMTYK